MFSQKRLNASPELRHEPFDPTVEERTRRKLSAILSADVKGYSRLMEYDEQATVLTITSYRKIMTSLTQSHGGRVVDAKGDNLLAEFPSVVDAVRCAAKIQERLRQENSRLPQYRRMEFRIGINFGDVIEDGGAIYGDGVNIAARLEGLAEGGGICLSGKVYEEVKKKLHFGYVYIGEQRVKNISEPVPVYRMLSDGSVAKEKPRLLRKPPWPALLILVALFAGLVIWKIHFAWYPSIESPSQSNIPANSSKPSIAVLPFLNISKEPEEEYFSDGITNDIITDLSKFQGLFLIASNTVFTYKGKSVKIDEIGRDLGVKYVIEGSVQKTGDHLRINVQLIDAASGHHIWADRYDRGLEDIFSVQDEIVGKIVGKLAVTINATERNRVMRRKTGSVDAYDYQLRGFAYLRERTRSTNLKAREMFEKAIELDPRYSSAYVGLGRVYAAQVSFGWAEFPGQALEKAGNLAQKALTLDESNGEAHALLGNVYVYKARHDLAIRELRKALELNPNDASTYHYLGMVLLWSGNPDEAIPALEAALRYDPNIMAGTFMFLGLGYYLKRQYDLAVRTLEEGSSRHPDFVGNHIALAAAYAQSGRMDDSERERQRVLRLDPFFEVSSYGTVFRHPEDRAAIVEGLRKAGLK